MDRFLEDNVEDRSVLFGRLLAVYDYMEQQAMFRQDESRTTNVKRYWNAFEQWTEEIMSHLSVNGFDNKPLSEMYLPGYYKQMEYMKQAFYKKEDSTEKE